MDLLEDSISCNNDSYNNSTAFVSYPILYLNNYIHNTQAEQISIIRIVTSLLRFVVHTCIYIYIYIYNIYIYIYIYNI